MEKLLYIENHFQLSTQTVSTYERDLVDINASLTFTVLLYIVDKKIIARNLYEEKELEAK